MPHLLTGQNHAAPSPLGLCSCALPPYPLFSFCHSHTQVHWVSALLSHPPDRRRATVFKLVLEALLLCPCSRIPHKVTSGYTLARLTFQLCDLVPALLLSSAVPSPSPLCPHLYLEPACSFFKTQFKHPFPGKPFLILQDSVNISVTTLVAFIV